MPHGPKGQTRAVASNYSKARNGSQCIKTFDTPENFWTFIGIDTRTV